ncbi:MAG: peptidylprolyl isomerase [Bacteroidota bacterium]|nr:peptidylprolyl isomerase [Bacteroidota bacterium]
MLKRLLLLLCLYSPLLAQFSSTDFELASSTFERKIDKKTIDRYLTSAFPSEVKAALLSLGNLQDTSFVKDIVKLDYKKYGDYISFALGQSGVNLQSEEFLLDKIQTNSNPPEYQRLCLEALGRCGSLNSLNSILDLYLSGKLQNPDGISIAIVNFSQRSIKPKDSSELNVLLKELTNLATPVKRRIDAAFALSRVSLPRSSANELLRVLFENAGTENDLVLKQYVLACLRRIKISPDSPEQIRSLITNKDWRIRTEAAKVIVFHSFRSSEELKRFLTLLNDVNPNVSRQTAISLKDINIDNSLLFLLKDELKRKLQDSSITDNTRGELFVTYCKFSPDEVFTLAESQKSNVKPSFIYRALSENVKSPLENLSYLLKGIEAADNNEKLEILNSMLSMQDLLSNNTQLSSYLLSSLSSNFPAVVSIAADGIDSIFINSHQDELKKIITRQVHLNLNNSSFSESNISLVNLAKRISPGLSNDLLLLLRSSELSSMQGFASRELGKPYNITKKMNNFFEIWTNAFKYRYAKVTTNKGTFQIKFHPEYAPISVGNFCKLAQSGFFDKVIFHRVVPDFVIQTGDPEGTGWGGPGYEIITESSPVPFDRSYVGMASSGKDTEGSQWFVMHSNFPHLNGKYSNFGKVTSGMDIVNQIDQGDSIISVELIK